MRGRPMTSRTCSSSSIGSGPTTTRSGRTGDRRSHPGRALPSHPFSHPPRHRARGAHVAGGSDHPHGVAHRGGDL
jgi:hypothetical protein